MTAVDPAAPLVSIVVPAHNATGTLARCLEAAARSARGRAEIIVVDDGSIDDTGEVARRHGATVVRQASQRGPAASRNSGAALAGGEVILFLDADVALAGDAIPRVVQALRADRDLAAVFGSYDDAPAVHTFVSEYRNLLHHFVHQTANEDSASFWAGCGAIRASVFRALGGFDEHYRRPSIEDIELGARLAASGYRVRLEKRVRGTHLKRWTLSSLVVADVRDRAYPWARLILQRGRMPADLNLRYAHRASAALVWFGAALALGLALGPATAQPLALVALLATVGGVILLNREFYRFLAERRGMLFAARAVPLHFLYYAYASATFACCWLHHRWAHRPATS